MVYRNFSMNRALSALSMLAAAATTAEQFLVTDCSGGGCAMISGLEGMLVGAFLRNRAFTSGLPVGANGDGLRGGEDGSDELEGAWSEELMTGAQSDSEAPASSLR